MAHESEVDKFLHHEANLLNTGQFDSWVDLLTEDFDYRVLDPEAHDDPFRSRYSEQRMLAWESINSLRIRFKRMQSEFAWADRPLGYQRRHITAVRVDPDADAAGDVVVESDVLVYRARKPDAPAVVSALRRDTLTVADGEFRLKCRRVFLDLDEINATHLALIY